jgi:hypothetical protein
MKTNRSVFADSYAEARWRDAVLERGLAVVDRAVAGIARVQPSA